MPLRPLPLRPPLRPLPLSLSLPLLLARHLAKQFCHLPRTPRCSTPALLPRNPRRSARLGDRLSLTLHAWS